MAMHTHDCCTMCDSPSDCLVCGDCREHCECDADDLDLIPQDDED